MMLPLAILAIGALFAGIINLPFNAGLPADALTQFLSRSPSIAMGYEAASMAYGKDNVAPAGFGAVDVGMKEVTFDIKPLVVGGAVALLGIGLAFALMMKEAAEEERRAQQNDRTVEES